MELCSVCECQQNKNYKIEKVNIDNKQLKNQLENLGFIKNEKLAVLKSNFGRSSFLIEVMGTQYAIDEKICRQIIVRKNIE